MTELALKLWSASELPTEAFENTDDQAPSQTIASGSLEDLFIKIIFNKLPGDSVFHPGNENTVGI